MEQRRLVLEKELLVDPEYFSALAHHSSPTWRAPTSSSSAADRPQRTHLATAMTPPPSYKHRRHRLLSP
ncbi:hypothetical protein LV779_36100 [Streptomyces thinghirensis]|nr:hypothetical protein [Streptomyces thinghirensis]